MRAMRSCRWTAALFVVTASAAAAQDAVRLDLNACLEQARAAAPRLEELRAAEAEAVASANEAAARRLPSLGLGATYRYASESMAAQISLAPGFPSRTLTFGDGHVADVNLALSLPLYTGGELSRTAAAADAGSRAATLRSAAATQDVVLAVRRTFYAALGRESQLAAAGLAVARLQRHADEVSGAVSVGAATVEMRLRAVTRLREAEQRQSRAQASLDSAAVALGRLVGRPGAAVLPAGELATPLLADDDVAAAAGERPDVAALQEERSRQDHLAAAARGRLLPRIAAELAAHHGRPGVDQLTNDWMSYATAGVSLDWPPGMAAPAGSGRRRPMRAPARWRPEAATCRKPSPPRRRRRRGTWRSPARNWRGRPNASTWPGTSASWSARATSARTPARASTSTPWTT
ncbi:MAG: TolC family protein [bacterium]|nr:TolC family protein [bacterium]